MKFSKVFPSCHDQFFQLRQAYSEQERDQLVFNSAELSAWIQVYAMQSKSQINLVIPIIDS